ncbi:MAG: PUA domain-containing protein [Methanocellales archaeon]
MSIELKRVRLIADYQFGSGAGEALFPDSTQFIFSSRDKVRQIYDGGRRIASLRASDGLLTLSFEGGERLRRFLPFPKLRVVVSDEAVPFVASGKSAFARHVIQVDPDLRAGEEVLIVDKNDCLLATGKAVLSAQEMLSFKKGVAVEIRVARE